MLVVTFSNSLTTQLSMKEENVVPDALSRRDYDFTRPADDPIDHPDLGAVHKQKSQENDKVLTVSPTKVKIDSLIKSIEYDQTFRS